MERLEIIIILVFIIAFVVMMIQVSPIFAEVSRGEIRNATARIDNANEKYGETDSLIILQRGIISNNENEYTILSQKLIKTESELASSWGAVQEINDIRNQTIISQIKLDESKTRLIALQQEKEMWFNERTQYQTQLENLNEDWIGENQPDLTGTTKLIGIKLSQSCILMIKNNITSSCPTYEELAQLDTSNTEYSGEFGYEDGYYHRLDSPYKMGYEIYKYDNTIRILVDPPSNQQSRIKMITIENNFGTFIEAPTDNKLYNNTITLHEKRDVKGCRTAQIATDGWMDLLPDTIYYLRTDCNVTSFDNTITTIRDDTEWKPEDSAGWHYRNWIESVKFLCLGLC